MKPSKRNSLNGGSRDMQRNTSRRPPAARDNDESTFTKILNDLIVRIPGAYAAALVDCDGESVDYAGSLAPFDIKVAAAHWRIILGLVTDMNASCALGSVRTFAVRAGKQSIVVRSMPDGYAIIVLCTRRAGFGQTARAFSACAYELAAEAGWKLLPEFTSWFPVTVECDARRRPARIVYGGLAEPVEVLGSLAARTSGLARRERGFRIRLASGPEITVVREPNGHWYVEESFGVESHERISLTSGSA
jgi:predicted regulator of Ras-like GTPase activity (Roadblock/LC7/MglB family)